MVVKKKRKDFCCCHLIFINDGFRDYTQYTEAMSAWSHIASVIIQAWWSKKLLSSWYNIIKALMSQNALVIWPQGWTFIVKKSNRWQPLKNIQQSFHEKLPKIISISNCDLTLTFLQIYVEKNHLVLPPLVLALFIRNYAS